MYELRDWPTHPQNDGLKLTGDRFSASPPKTDRLTYSQRSLYAHGWYAIGATPAAAYLRLAIVRSPAHA